MGEVSRCEFFFEDKLLDREWLLLKGKLEKGDI